MTEVLSLMDKVSSSAKVHPAYDHIAFTQIPKERFEDLKKAFVVYDKEKKGEIKTVGKIARHQFSVKILCTKNATVCGSGCGSVARAVTSNTRGPRFESNHWQNLFNICLLSTVLKRQNKEK